MRYLFLQNLFHQGTTLQAVFLLNRNGLVPSFRAKIIVS